MLENYIAVCGLISGCLGILGVVGLLISLDSDAKPLRKHIHAASATCFLVAVTSPLTLPLFFALLFGGATVYLVYYVISEFKNLSQKLPF